MDNQTAQTTPNNPLTPPSSTGTQGPVVVSPGTSTSSITPVAPPQKNDDKNKGLIIVAVILIILISVLAVVYYLIIKQSSTPTETVNPPVVVSPTIAQPTATPTPSDEEILNESNLEDPTTDIAPIQQDLTNL